MRTHYHCTCDDIPYLPVKALLHLQHHVDRLTVFGKDSRCQRVDLSGACSFPCVGSVCGLIRSAYGSASACTLFAFDLRGLCRATPGSHVAGSSGRSCAQISNGQRGTSDVTETMGEAMDITKCVLAKWLRTRAAHPSAAYSRAF